MPKLIATMPLKRIDALPAGRHAVAENLYLFRSATGGASWVFRYFDGKRKIDLGIGSARAMSRDDAIAKVAELQALRKAGVDPLTERRARVITDAVKVPTFREAMIAYHAEQAKGWSKSHADAWLKEMERECLPAIGDMRVDKIEVADVLRALAGWSTRHETVSRCRGRLEKILDAEKALKHRSGENPAQWKGNLESLLASPTMLKKARGEQHHKALPWDRLPDFVAALPDTEAGRALRFLILTAGRSTEVAGCTWREIDLEAGVWTIPPHRMKARRKHVVALSGAALAILRGIKRTADDLVFPALGRDDMRELIPDATAHGMRSCFSTWAGDHGFNRDVVERCLAHKLESTEAAYRRGDEIEPKRRVMEAWGRYLTEGENQGIVVLTQRRA